VEPLASDYKSQVDELMTEASGQIDTSQTRYSRSGGLPEIAREFVSREREKENWCWERGTAEQKSDGFARFAMA
jgi:hypothetical protein